MTKDQYLLTCLAEECAEVAQRASKAIRFGLFEVEPGQSATNWDRLRNELGDLLGVMDALGLEECAETREAKPGRCEKYMEYSRRQGCVE